MNIDKIVLVIFKNTAINLQVLCINPKETDAWMLINTTSKGDLNNTKEEALNLLNKYNIKEPKINLDLGILIYDKIYYKGYAIQTDQEISDITLPDYIKDASFESVEQSIEKTLSPYKDFLTKFSIWNVVK
jgi:hypothetical protein